MPAIMKLLMRRTLATSAMNPASILSPSSLTLKNGGGKRMYSVCVGGRRSTLARGGACLRVSGAHVNNKNILMCNNNTTSSPHNKKKIYMLSPRYSSSSSTSSSPFSEEREREKQKFGSTGSRVSSSSSDYLVANMGHENAHQNGTVSPPNNKDHEKEEEEQCSKLLTLPTVLTLARVAAIPVFIGTFYVNSWWGTAATTSIFVAAAITDWLDGYLARKMRLGTAFGAFLDPVADKLMVAATLVLLCSRPPETALLGDLPWLFPVPAIAIIGREITMSAVREWAASQNAKLLQAVAVNNLGKWKTATQMTALTILVASRDSSLGGSGALVTSGVALLYISAGLAVWSLVVYMRKIWRVLLR